MAHTLASLLLRVKDDPTRIVDPHVFGAAAASLDHARQLELFGPARRSRVLTPLMTVTAVIVQALHGNTALCDLGRKTGLHVTASAFGYRNGVRPRFAYAPFRYPCRTGLLPGPFLLLFSSRPLIFS